MGCERKDYLDNRKARIENNLNFFKDKSSIIADMSKKDAKSYKKQRTLECELELVCIKVEENM